MTDDLSSLNGGTDVADLPSDTGAVSLDSLHESEVNQAQVDDTLRRGLAPNGTYTTDPQELGEMTATLNVVEEKDDAGTVIGTRRVITFTGMGRAQVRVSDGNGVVESKVVEARLRVQISPDARFKKDYETGALLGTRDSKTTLYAAAVKAYANHYKEAPKNDKQIVDYLCIEPVRFRMIQVGVPTKRNPTPDGEPRNHCMGIYSLRGK